MSEIERATVTYNEGVTCPRCGIKITVGKPELDRLKDGDLPVVFQCGCGWTGRMIFEACYPTSVKFEGIPAERDGE